MIKKLTYICRAARRIAFFKKQYRVSTLFKEMFMFPVDYFLRRGRSSGIRNLTVIVTNNCNLRCSWCFFKGELDNPKTLDLGLYCRLIDNTAGFRPAVVLSGGEPFANRDILEYVKKAKQYSLPLSIFTNGVLLTPQMLDKLAAYKLDYLCISIIGPEDVHNRITGTRTYMKLKENLEYLAGMDRKGMKFIINVTLSGEMLDNLEYIREFIKRYKVDAVRFQHLNFLRDREFRENAEAFKKLFDYDLNIHRNKDVPAFYPADIDKMCALIRDTPGIRQEAPALSKEEMGDWYIREHFKTDRRCIFPWRGAQIGADGIVYPCYKMYYPMGDLNQKPFTGIWNDEKYVLFRNELKKRLFPGCARCCKL